uniref:Uncharacterized protein n=1 Tax=Brassica oleracea TaxID=3712 RepID=A0A3P6EXP8_BRAOL|nr:unnamed protein product [Brassica oleracea]
MVSEDFGINLTLINLELSYLPSELINTLEPPPVIISNDRQVKKFLTYVKTKPSTSLYVNSGETYFDEQDIERDENEDCSWRVRAEELKGSSYFIIRKYVAEHSCAPSARNKSVRTASAKTIGNLIMHKHAVKAGFSVGRPVHSLTDEKYTTSSWISVYEERINLISVPEDAWIVLEHVEKAKFLSPESRRAAGRRKKRRYETVKVKICSQGSKGSTRRKCSSCGIEGHNRSTCDRAI